MKANKSPDALRLDKDRLEAAAADLENGAVTPSAPQRRDDLLRLLNDALATELVCVLRYRRHHFTATGRPSAAIAEEFLVHADAELAHADRIAERIAQLGGEPDFNPAILIERSHAQYTEADSLETMIRDNLVAERVAVESYRQLVALVADRDPTTRRMLEDILAEEEAHADELKDWLEP